MYMVEDGHEFNIISTAPFKSQLSNNVSPPFDSMYTTNRQVELDCEDAWRGKRGGKKKEKKLLQAAKDISTTKTRIDRKYAMKSGCMTCRDETVKRRTLVVATTLRTEWTPQ